jgi:hypothetical protein
MQTVIPLCACGCGETVALTREGRPNTGDFFKAIVGRLTLLVELL